MVRQVLLPPVGGGNGAQVNPDVPLVVGIGIRPGQTPVCSVHLGRKTQNMAGMQRWKQTLYKERLKLWDLQDTWW